jgi:uncharacterized phage protein (TIGR01671 family)
MIPKFRGKTIKGFLVVGYVSVVTDKGAGVEPGTYISNGIGLPFAYEVDPKTVGQSTGLKDKNGVEVFQGDVVVHEEGEYSYKGVVLKDKYYFYIEGVNINDSFSFDDISNTLIGEADLEVIGNIFENPELLEQANEN